MPRSRSCGARCRRPRGCTLWRAIESVGVHSQKGVHATSNGGVQSRHVVEKIQAESVGLFCPTLTNAFKRREPAEALQALRKGVRIEDRGHMRTKAGMGGEEEPAGFLDGAIHPCDL